MAARGYDDTALIAEIDALMRANPAMSRRQAIKQVAGEGSLRRIEAKMIKRDAPRLSTEEVEEIAIPMRPTPTQAMLAKAEELTLAGTGERVRWSGFNDLAALVELRRRREGPLPLPIRLLCSAIVLGIVAIMAAPIFDERILFETSLALTAVVALLGLPFMFVLIVVYCVCDAIVSVIRGCPMPSVRYTKDDLMPVREQDTRRFVLTDKAFYALVPDGADVRIRRYASSAATSVSRTADGEPELHFGLEKVSLDAVPGSKILLTRMGFSEAERSEPSGMAVPG